MGLEPGKVSEREAVWRMGALWMREMGRNGIVNKRNGRLTNLNSEPLWNWWYSPCQPLVLDTLSSKEKITGFSYVSFDLWTKIAALTCLLATLFPPTFSFMLSSMLFKYWLKCLCIRDAVSDLSYLIFANPVSYSLSQCPEFKKRIVLIAIWNYLLT